MSEFFHTPTSMFPWRRKPIPPNIFLSSMLFLRAKASRMRSARAYFKAIGEFSQGSMRQLDLDAVSRCNRQQLLDFLFRGRQSGRRTFRNRHAKLEEHLLQPGRCNRNQQLGWSAALVLEGVRRSDRHVGEHPGTGHESFVANREGNLAFKDVKTLLLPAVNVRGGTAPWRHHGFQQDGLAVRVLAGRQKAVQVADDGHGPPFPWLLDDGLCHVRLPHLLTVERPTSSLVLISRRC